MIALNSLLATSIRSNLLQSMRKPHIALWLSILARWSQFAFSHLPLSLMWGSWPLSRKFPTRFKPRIWGLSTILQAARSIMGHSTSLVLTLRVAVLSSPQRYSLEVVSQASHSWLSPRSPSLSITMSNRTRGTLLRPSFGRMEQSQSEWTLLMPRLSRLSSRSPMNAL